MNPHDTRPRQGASSLYRVALACVSAGLVGACSEAPNGSSAGDGLSVLTLNLHTYQQLATEGVAEADLTNREAEERVLAYGPIFDRVAAGISELDPDIICFQEVAEWPAGPTPSFGASKSNMVRQILSRVDESYYIYMDWSHYGWEVWLEGSAVVSRFPIKATESRFISQPADDARTSWKSRNVPMARIDAPGIGDVAVFSVHTGWWDDPDEPSRAQFVRLFDWADEVDASMTILCGDFNAPAGGPAYQFLTSESGYSDVYFEANPDGMYDATIGGGAHGWEDSEDAQRIDFVLVNEDASIRVVVAQRVFTGNDFGPVSDHVGVFTQFAGSE